MGCLLPLTNWLTVMGFVMVKCVCQIRMYSPKLTGSSVPWITSPPYPQHTFLSFQVNHACFQTGLDVCLKQKVLWI